MSRSRSRARVQVGRVARRLRRVTTPAPVPVPPPDLAARLASVDRAADRRLLRLAGTVLDRPRPKIAVLAPGPAGSFVRAARAVAPGARVHVVVGPADPHALHVELAARGPFHVMVDLLVDQPAGRRAERARAVLPHLHRDGVLVVRQARRRPSGGGRADLGAAPHSDFSTVLGAALDAAVGAGPRPGKGDRWWGRTVSAVSWDRGDLAVVNALVARPKVREEDADAYLAHRRGAGSVILERPGSVVSNPHRPVTSSHPHAIDILTRVEAPRVQLRQYHDVVCWTGQVVTQGRALLPETYRHLAADRLINPTWLDDVAPEFAVLKDTASPRRLDGTWFHLDSEFRGHYGHAMSEQVSRLWAWREAKERVPDLKALLLTNRTRTGIASWERRLYRAAGVAEEDLVVVDGPVRVERLLAATPMLSQPAYIHAGLRDLYREMGDDLAADAPDRAYPARLFVSRRNDRRVCHNLEVVEALFAEHGFEVVYPEDLPLGEQVQHFRSADVLAGFAGSGMFNVAFVPEPTPVVLVSTENYVAQNEPLMAAALGHPLAVSFSDADKPRSQGWRGEEALQSGFTFDPEREGRFLRDLFTDPAWLPPT